MTVIEDSPEIIKDSPGYRAFSTTINLASSCMSNWEMLFVLTRQNADKSVAFHSIAKNVSDSMKMEVINDFCHRTLRYCDEDEEDAPDVDETEMEEDAYKSALESTSVRDFMLEETKFSASTGHDVRFDLPPCKAVSIQLDIAENTEIPQDAADHDPGSLLAGTIAKASESEPVLPDEKLVTTQTLLKHDLAYNTRYKMIICLICETGLPVSKVRDHTRYNHSRSVIMSDVISELGHAVADSKSDIMDVIGWEKKALPLPGQEGPVLGLQIHSNKVVCGICKSYGGSLTAVRKHRQKEHPDCDGSNVTGSFQTMTSIPSYAKYFPTPKKTQEASLTDSKSVEDGFEEMVTLLRKTKLDAPGKFVSQDIRSIPPVLNHLGIPKFLSEQNENHLLQIIKIEQHEDFPTLFPPLRRLVSKAFFEDCDSLSNVNPALGFTIMNCNPSRGSSREFRSPAHETQVLYALGETDFLFACIIASHVIKGHPIVLNSAQREAVRFLEIAIRSGVDDHSSMALLRKALRALYFPPKDLRELRDAFISPSIAYSAIRCLDKAGGYLRPYRYTIHLAKLQFSLRLHGLRYLRELLQTAKDQKTHEEKNWIQSVAKPFCETYLMESQFSLFSTLRYWLHEFKCAASNSPRPHLHRWVGSVTAQIGNQIIDVERYKAFVNSEMKKLEDHVLEKILCGVALEDFPDISTHLDTGDEKTPGYSVPFSDSDSETLDNLDSDGFVRSLVGCGALGSKLHPRLGVTWDREQCVRWLDHLQDAWKIVSCLVHVTTGSPAYSAEECLYQITNFGGKPRNLHAADGRFLIVTNYVRGNSKYGRKRAIFLSKGLSRILLILLRATRPLELFFLLDFKTHGGKEREVLEVYKNFLYATSGKRWTPDLLQNQLSLWFERGLGFPMTYNKYKRLFELIHGSQIQRIIRDPIAVAADKQTGHHPLASEKSYARLHGTSELGEFQWNSFLQASDSVQKWFGI